MTNISSANGIISLLEEKDSQLQVAALELLLKVVDQFWSEIADSVPFIESLFEDPGFPNTELAAAVASKCYFHLEEYEEALRLAMGAGKYFDLNEESQYVHTLIATCVDGYIVKMKQDRSNMDPRMEEIVEKMYQKCYEDGELEQALGVALESHCLEKVKQVFAKAKDLMKILSFCFKVCRNITMDREFRFIVLGEMVKMYESMEQSDYLNTCQCLQMLNKHEQVANTLDKLMKSNVDDTLVGYQVAFDLYENDNSRFLAAVVNGLPKVDESKAEKEYNSRMEKLHNILSGKFSRSLALDVLGRNTKMDKLLMTRLKDAVEGRNSVLHNAAVVTHAYMNAGTTNDQFLRNNLSWMGKASNWAKFTATASIGVVHKGHTSESLNLLQPYLPRGGVSSSPYTEGGALYALGLIHANAGAECNKERITYLRTALKNAGTNEVLQHGSCLGIGLAAMASHDYEIYEELKNILFTDSAVAGEASSLAIGMVLLGAGSTDDRSGAIVTELLAYAHDTKHEKIIRGACLAISLIMYGREQEADVLIEQMCRDKDPVIRYGGMYTIAMAYAGTANNVAVKRLLHVAVSDVSGDVRRAAVTCLGFLLYRTPVKVPKLVSLLAESFNPHVRYGSCLAIGIACAGTGKNEAISLLEPMQDDPVDFVRQGATMALGMVLMQESEHKNQSVKKFRDRLSKTISDKHQTTMTKVGAILGQGIVDAGGRNTVISLESRTGFSKVSSVVGLAIWAQHWYWYPLMHFLELSIEPTFMVGLNHNLAMPTDFSATCNAKASLFAYPKPLEEKKEEKKELVATAILSTTAKAKARELQKEGNTDGPTPMDEEETKVEEQKSTAMDVEDDKSSPAAEKPSEPDSFTVSNPSRVTPYQEPHLTTDTSNRYLPVVQETRLGGIVMLRDTTPSASENVLQVQPPVNHALEDEKDAEPPLPFNWTPPSSSA